MIDAATEERGREKPMVSFGAAGATIRTGQARIRPLRRIAQSAVERIMKRPIVRFRLNLTLTRAAGRRKGWEELVAVGMDDLELSRLNQVNTRDPVHSPWEGARRMCESPRKV
jgi:hypothetical protein